MRKLISLLTLIGLAISAQSQSWSISGNAGTSPAIHFLGTTDNNPLKFRINNNNAGEIDSAGGQTFLGYRSGNNNFFNSNNNTAVGYKSLSSVTPSDVVGYWNTAVGAYAMYLNTGGRSNIASGVRALYNNSGGSFNTATGVQALFQNTTGSLNTASGFNSLYSNVAGLYNTANGAYSMYSNSGGYYNTANGYYALYSNTSGSNNTASGSSALRATTTGSGNTASGFNSLYSNTTGGDNTATGSYALFSNTNTWYNTATGGYALYSNTTGCCNNANGYSALRYNTSGAYNTADGRTALYSNTTGSGNTATGMAALSSNTSGSQNTALGYYALNFNSTTSYNTAIGASALNATTGSQYNTAIGFNAGASYNLGWNNTFLGARTTTNSAGLYNCIAIGQDVTNTASSQARIGNSATNSIGGYANWTNISDSRYKKDINQNVKGLDFIMRLQPVTYHLDISGLSKKLNEGRGEAIDEYTQRAIKEKEKILFSGFVAQDVEKAAKESGYDFSGVDKPKNENDLYGLRYAEFIVPLVKGMQEQQALILQQGEVINELLKQNINLQNRISELEKRNGISSSFNSDDALSVRPNPSSDKIFINIVSVNESQVRLRLFDGKGALVKEQRAAVSPGNNQFGMDISMAAKGIYMLSAEWDNGQVKKTAQVIKQ